MPAAPPPTPFLRLGRMLLVLAMCASVGMHWAALQAVAWTQMLVTYSQHATLSEAVARTFDGAHPCELCLLVKQGRSGEKEQDALPLLKKLDAVLAVQPAMPLRVARTMEFPTFQNDAEARQARPPAPPPRT